jgi:hypothetical protein
VKGGFVVTVKRIAATRVVVRCALALIVLGISGIATAHAAPASNRYTDAAHGFSFVYPASWTFGSSPSDKVLRSLGISATTVGFSHDLRAVFGVSVRPIPSTMDQMKSAALALFHDGTKAVGTITFGTARDRAGWPVITAQAHVSANSMDAGSYAFSFVSTGQRTIYVRAITMTKPAMATALDMAELRAIEQSVRYS